MLSNITTLTAIGRTIITAISFFVPVAATAAIHTVGPDKEFPTPAQIVWSKIVPGDTVVIYPGTYSAMGTGNSMTVAAVKGTAALPITIKAYNADTRPVLVDGVNVANGSQYVVIRDLDISRTLDTPSAALVVQSGSSDILLSNLKVHGAYVGVNIEHAGLRNRLESSEIYGNVYNGIGLAAADSVPDENNRSYIAGNSVHDNGSHGMEVASSYWRIEKNLVFNNGLSIAGTSGIHLYSYTDSKGLDCDHNEIYYNYVSGQKDNQLADGNGIQSDNFCDYNVIAFNVVWANDGAGISQLTGKGNVIVANTSYHNAQDKHRVEIGGDRGEIILGSWSDLCSNPYVDPNTCNIDAGRSSGNIVYDNLVYSDQSTVAGIHATDDYIDPHRNINHFYPNLYYNAAGGINLQWGSATYSTAAEIDNITGLDALGGGNLVELRLFLNAANPGPGSDGLRLSMKTSKEGWTVQPAMPDMMGVAPAADAYYFGAYYMQP